MRIVVINPTYNEKENIQTLIKKLAEVKEVLSDELIELIVDDNSPDGTGGVVQQLQKEHPFVHLIQGEKKGLGEAYIRGMQYAMKELNADVIVQMDADLQHDPSILPDMIAKMHEGYDFVIGSRYVPGGSYPQEWGRFRVLNSQIANALARYIAGFKEVHDCTAGYKIIKVKACLDQVQFNKLHAIGYSFQLMLLSEIMNQDVSVYEFPIHFQERYKGQSKVGMNSQYIKDIFEFFRNAVWIRKDKMFSKKYTKAHITTTPHNEKVPL